MAIKPDIDSVNVFLIKHIKLLEQFYIPKEAIILVKGDVASENTLPFFKSKTTTKQLLLVYIRF